MATIRKRRDKWQVQVRRTGHRPVTKTFRFRKDAESWARHTEAKVEAGDTWVDTKVLHVTTLATLVERYRDSVSVLKRSADTERVVLNNFLSHPICRRKLSEVRTEDFAKYRDERLGSIKAATLKRQLNPIRHLFEVARDDWGLPIRDNPLRKLKLDAADNHRERRLRGGEFDRLIAAAQTRRNPLIEKIIRFALATAMRRGEIVSIRWAHVNRSDRSLLIPDAKNGHSRIIPLTREALAILDGDHGDADHLVFPIKGEAFRLAWDRVTAAARIQDLRFHDLRHEAISVFFEKGLSVPEVALISGHRDMRMLFRYSHATRSTILSRLDLFDTVTSTKLPNRC